MERRHHPVVQTPAAGKEKKMFHYEPTKVIGGMVRMLMPQPSYVHGDLDRYSGGTPQHGQCAAGRQPRKSLPCARTARSFPGIEGQGLDRRLLDSRRAKKKKKKKKKKKGSSQGFIRGISPRRPKGGRAEGNISGTWAHLFSKAP